MASDIVMMLILAAAACVAVLVMSKTPTVPGSIELCERIGGYVLMTGLDEMTSYEIWDLVEDCLYSIYKDVENSGYSEHSMTGARHIQHLVRKNLICIDRALLEIDIRAKSKEKQVGL